MFIFVLNIGSTSILMTFLFTSSISSLYMTHLDCDIFISKFHPNFVFNYLIQTIKVKQYLKLLLNYKMYVYIIQLFTHIIIFVKKIIKTTINISKL